MKHSRECSLCLEEWAPNSNASNRKSSALTERDATDPESDEWFDENYIAQLQTELAVVFSTDDPERILRVFNCSGVISRHPGFRARRARTVASSPRPPRNQSEQSRLIHRVLAVN